MSNRRSRFDLLVKEMNSVKEKGKILKKNRLIEVVVKVVVAALTAFLTALGTTSCMGRGPF